MTRVLVFVLVLAIAALAGCDDDCRQTSCGPRCGAAIAHCTFDAFGADAPGRCNVLTQAGCLVGEKCTWLVDALMPVYVGHIGCAPSGTARAGDACMYGFPGATGYDNCERGAACGDTRGGTSTCRHICDPQGGQPMCSAIETCTEHAEAFIDSGDGAVAGLCEPQ